MTDIAIFAASDLEYRALRSLLTEWQSGNSQIMGGRGWCGENRIDLFCTAMGPQNASRQGARAFAQSTPSLVLISGFAGGLTPECRCGDMVVYRNCQFPPDDNNRENSSIT